MPLVSSGLPYQVLRPAKVEIPVEVSPSAVQIQLWEDYSQEEQLHYWLQLWVVAVEQMLDPAAAGLKMAYS